MFKSYMLRMLRWICGHKRIDKIMNGDIWNKFIVFPLSRRLESEILIVCTCEDNVTVRR